MGDILLFQIKSKEQNRLGHGEGEEGEALGQAEEGASLLGRFTVSSYPFQRPHGGSGLKEEREVGREGDFPSRRAAEAGRAGQTHAGPCWLLCFLETSAITRGHDLDHLPSGLPRKAVKHNQSRGLWVAKGPELPTVLVVISAASQVSRELFPAESSQQEPEGHQGSGPSGWDVLPGLGLCAWCSGPQNPGKGGGVTS